jgi:hypothetical protein
MFLNVSVRNQHATEKKKKTFQYIEKNLEDVEKMILNVLVRNQKANEKKKRKTFNIYKKNDKNIPKYRE